MSNFIANSDGISPAYQFSFDLNGNTYVAVISLTNSAVTGVATDDFESTLTECVYSLNTENYTGATLTRLDEAETQTNLVTVVVREILVSTDSINFSSLESVELQVNTITSFIGYVKLNSEPRETITVTDSNGDTYTFTTENWATAQEVSVSNIHTYGYSNGQVIGGVGFSDGSSTYAGAEINETVN